MIDTPDGLTIQRPDARKSFMAQLELYSRSQLSSWRDRTASRHYSAEREEFRREHERHREWGLRQRHGRRAMYLRIHGDVTPPTDRIGGGRASEPAASINTNRSPSPTLPSPLIPPGTVDLAGHASHASESDRGDPEDSTGQASPAGRAGQSDRIERAMSGPAGALDATGKSRRPIHARPATRRPVPPTDRMRNRLYNPQWMKSAGFDRGQLKLGFSWRPSGDLASGRAFKVHMLDGSTKNFEQRITSTTRLMPENEFRDLVAAYSGATPAEHRGWLHERIGYANAPPLRKRLSELAAGAGLAARALSASNVVPSTACEEP